MGLGWQSPPDCRRDGLLHGLSYHRLQAFGETRNGERKAVVAAEEEAPGAVMNLKQSARQWVLQNLPYDLSDASLVAHLNGLDAHALLVAYHNWMNRLVKPQARAVHKSRAFQQNPLMTQRASDLTQIVADIEAGRDLTKYLGRNIARAVVRQPGSPRADLDLMLNEWDVHHLHISTQVETNGFVSRTGPLLFAMFKPQAAYLIDIMPHGSWTRIHVLTVVADEWPNEGLLNEIRGAIAGTYFQPTDRERAVLRGKHVNATFEYGRKVFRPAGGLMTSGTTLAATRAADQLLNHVEVFEQWVAQNPEGLRSAFEQRGLVFPDNPRFEFAISGDGYGVIEINSGAWLNAKEIARLIKLKR